MERIEWWIGWLFIAAVVGIIWNNRAHAGPLEATVSITLPGTEEPINGAGVVIKEGLVVTAAHVVRNKKMAMLGRGDSMVYATVVSVDKEKDLALLEADIGCPCVSLAKNDPVRMTHVETHGYPLGIQITTEGRVQAYDNKGFLVVTAPVSPGNSGGGVFNDAGELVGVVSHVGGYGGSLVTHITFMSPVEVISLFIGNR